MFYGWYILGSGSFLILYIAGVASLGFTAVFEPIANEFPSWSYAQISLATSFRGLETNLLGPVAGYLVDRWGPRRLVFGGSIIICLGFFMLSRVTSLPMFYGTFFIIAAGISLSGGVVLMTTVNNWFRKRAALVTAILGSGAGLGGLLIPVLTRVIDAVEWRQAMVIVGLGMLAIGLPLSLVLRHKPEQYGYQPDGDTYTAVETKEEQKPQLEPEVNVSAKQALKNKVFWYMAIATMCSSFIVSAVLTHVMPYLGSLGVDRSLSSMAALGASVLSISGRLGGVWLGNRYGTKSVYIASFVISAVSLLIFGYLAPGRFWLIVPFVAAFGFSRGCLALSKVVLQREYFGRGSFGMIFGLMDVIQMLGLMAGAPLAGWVFDTWGSYQGAWLAYSLVALVGVVLIMAIPASSKNS